MQQPGELRQPAQQGGRAPGQEAGGGLQGEHLLGDLRPRAQPAPAEAGVRARGQHRGHARGLAAAPGRAGGRPRVRRVSESEAAGALQRAPAPAPAPGEQSGRPRPPLPEQGRAVRADTAALPTQQLPAGAGRQGGGGGVARGGAGRGGGVYVRQHGEPHPARPGHQARSRSQDQI